jgi:hypothetical protein
MTASAIQKSDSVATAQNAQQKKAECARVLVKFCNFWVATAIIHKNNGNWAGVEICQKAYNQAQAELYEIANVQYKTFIQALYEYNERQ